MSWTYISPILQKLSDHSTLFGKYWVSLVILRIVVLNTFIESIWSDEFGAFLCNTKEIGCDHLCFNELTPLSNVRLWGIQLLCISLPACLYLVYVWHLVVKNEKSEQKNNNDVDDPEKQAFLKKLRNMPTSKIIPKLIENSDDLKERQRISSYQDSRSSFENVRNRATGLSTRESQNSLDNRDLPNSINYAGAESGISITRSMNNLDFERLNIPNWYRKPIARDQRKYKEYDKIKKSILPQILQKVSFQKQRNERNIWRLYYLQVFVRIGIDVGFIMLQYNIYPYSTAFGKCRITNKFLA